MSNENDKQGGKLKYIVLRRLDTAVPGQLYLAGDHPLDNAKVTITIADCLEQDAPAKVVAETTIDLPQRPVSNWLPFEVPVIWKKVPRDAILSALSISARVTVGDQLVAVTKVNYPCNLGKDVHYPAFVTVVAEPV